MLVPVQAVVIVVDAVVETADLLDQEAVVEIVIVEALEVNAHLEETLMVVEEENARILVPMEAVKVNVLVQDSVTSQEEVVMKLKNVGNLVTIIIDIIKKGYPNGRALKKLTF